MSLNPVFISIGAAVFLKEHIGPRRLFAIAASLLGAALILKPFSTTFTPDAMWPLLAALCYSGYALITRRVGANEDVWTSLLYTAAFGSAVLSLGLPLYWVTPSGLDLVIVLPLIGLGTLGHLLLIRAFSLGEASMLAPYSYVGLVFAGTWGALFFSEWPDGGTLLGALVIALAGLYVWHRETRARGQSA